MKALVTGFEPFGGAASNPSWTAVRELSVRWATAGHEHELVVACLPVTFDGAPATLRTLVEEHRADVVVCTGLAVGTSALRLERVAVNVADARIPDNDGAQPVDEAVVAGGPAAYFSSLPLKGTLAAVREAGIAADLSNTAGTYVCNATFYALRHATDRAGARAGFVHLPAADMLDAATAARALEIVVRRAFDDVAGLVTEPRLAAGAEH